MQRVLSGAIGALGALLVAAPANELGALDATVPHSNGLATRKASGSPPEEPLPVLTTLVQTHTDERVIVDERAPTLERFGALLSDHVTGETHPVDPKLLELLRALARKHPGARIELVSGYRSPKLNEMLRKKGHHVASHSQHSLGHAVDFRIVEASETRGIDPRVLEREIRALGWIGGVGVYTGVASDWFVHADVGPQRGWSG